MAPSDREEKGETPEDRILSELRRLAGRVDRLESRVDDLSRPPRPQAERVLTFVDGLDAALGGGLPPGHVVVLAGPTGAMKTSLALHVLHRNAAAGHPGVFVSLEESRDSLLATMRGLGMEPTVPSSVGRGKSKKSFIVDIGRLRTEHETAEVVARDWLLILREFLERRRGKQPADLVAIDPLNSLVALADMAKPRQELFHFFHFLRSLGATTILVAETDDADRALVSAASHLADGLLEIRSADPAAGRPGLSIRVVKMRHAEHAREWYDFAFRGGTFTATPPAA